MQTLLSLDHVRRTVMRSVLTCDSLKLVIRHVQRCINYLLIKYAWCINITTASQTIFIFVAHTHVLGSQGSMVFARKTAVSVHLVFRP